MTSSILNLTGYIYSSVRKVAPSINGVGNVFYHSMQIMLTINRSKILKMDTAANTVIEWSAPI